MNTPPDAALWLLLFVLPITFWTIFTDLKAMRISNMAVLALVAVFAVVGFLVLPLQDWAWRWTHLVAILVLGFVLNQIGGVGAGDAKLAAAAAPFVALQDWLVVALLLGVMLPFAFVVHRIFRAIPAVRRATADWESWSRPRDFPMGLAIAPTLAFYLIIAALPALR